MNPLEGASPALTGHATDALESLIVRSQPPGSSRVRHASRLSRFYKNGALYSFSIAVNNPSDILFRPHQLSSTLTNSHRLSFSSALILISSHQPSSAIGSQHLPAALSSSHHVVRCHVPIWQKYIWDIERSTGCRVLGTIDTIRTFGGVRVRRKLSVRACKGYL